MNIKEQVLSIEQIKELRELGFDFRKYSSVYVIEAKDRNKYIVDRRLIGLHISLMETKVLEYYETMTIGDIIEVLPEKINNNFFLMFEKDYVAYNNRYLVLMSKEEKNLITALFETLKWCIKQKYIEL